MPISIFVVVFRIIIFKFEGYYSDIGKIGIILWKGFGNLFSQIYIFLNFFVAAFSSNEIKGSKLVTIEIIDAFVKEMQTVAKWLSLV